MTFAELLNQISWPTLKAALLRCYPDEKESLERYRLLYGKLKAFDPEPTTMRIIVKDAGPYMDVLGRNGERNRDQPDFEHFRHEAEPGWADQETDWSLCLNPWAEWLGMTVDSVTLGSIPHPQIAAHCLYEMTFHGLEEDEVKRVGEEIKRRVDELDAMTPEEREKYLVPHEEVMKRLNAKLDEE